MKTKIWEQTISGTSIAGGATQWFNGDSIRLSRPKGRYVTIQARVKVLSRGGQNLEVKVWGQDSTIWPGDSSYQVGYQGWVSQLIGTATTVNADDTLLPPKLEKAYLPSVGLRGAISVKNLGGASATPQIQVEFWVNEEN